jgi:hypothetical protein
VNKTDKLIQNPHVRCERHPGSIEELTVRGTFGFLSKLHREPILLDRSGCRHATGAERARLGHIVCLSVDPDVGVQAIVVDTIEHELVAPR